jgi:acyl dehydratase
MTAAQPVPYRVEAANISHASENKIHDDTVAQKLGFAGGLVPGVEVFAYACHPVVRHWSRAWLERGQMQCRFVKPVYDGRIAVASAQEVDGGLDLKVDSEGVLCATGRASLPEHAGAPPSVDAYERRSPPAAARRPPADQTSLAQGAWFGIAPVRVTADYIANYVRDIREVDPIYAEEGIVHPGLLLRLCNLALRENVVLPPWIHTGSMVTNFALARVGDELSARARVADNYERKGHRLVDLDVLIVANGKTAVAHVVHTAVYRLRHLAEAS